MILDLSARLSRISPLSDNSNKEQYSTIIESFPINIQPASAELLVLAEGKLGQTFQAFTTVSGIEIGDKVTVSGINTIYTVKGVDNWNMQPLPHLELVLFKGDA